MSRLMAANGCRNVRAARGRVAMTGGRNDVICSPYAQSGLLWELVAETTGPMTVRPSCGERSAPEMNPLLSGDYLDRMAQDDPEGYESEVLGGFRAGLYLSWIRRRLLRASIPACVSGRPQPNASGRRWWFVRLPSGGRRRCGGRRPWRKPVPTWSRDSLRHSRRGKSAV